MKWTRIRIVAFLLFLAASCTSPETQGEYQIEVTGAVNRTLSGTMGLEYVIDQGRNEISIFRQSISDEIQSLTIVFPIGSQPGTYTVSPGGPASAGYYIYNDGVTQPYTDNDQGWFAFQTENGTLSATMDFSLDAQSGTGERIRITGEIWDIPYKEVGGGHSAA
jgi:hypothetical protein